MKISKYLNALSIAVLLAVAFTIIATPFVGMFAAKIVGVLVGAISFSMSSGFVPTVAGALGAQYAATALAKAQSKLIQKYASTEMREIDPVTFRALRRSSEIMFPSHKELRTREDRTIEAGYLSRTVRDLSVGRVHNPSGATGVSAQLTPSFVTYSDPFSISMKQADNNVFSYEEMMQTLVENCLKNFSRGNEQNSVNYIFTNRSGVNNGVAEGTFVTAGAKNTFEINESQVGNRAVQVSQTNMAENLYGGMALTVFCDSIAYNKFMFLSKQGATNATNTSFQFENMTFVLSLGLTAKAATLGYTKGFWEIAADGTFGVLDWIPKQNRETRDVAPYKWSSFLNPIDGLDYAVFTTYVAQDSTATGGYTQDLLTNIEFSIDLAPEIAPTDIGGAGETVLQAFALV